MFQTRHSPCPEGHGARHKEVQNDTKCPDVHRWSNVVVILKNIELDFPLNKMQTLLGTALELHKEGNHRMWSNAALPYPAE